MISIFYIWDFKFIFFFFLLCTSFYFIVSTLIAVALYLSKRHDNVFDHQLSWTMSWTNSHCSDWGAPREKLCYSWQNQSQINSTNELNYFSDSLSHWSFLSESAKVTKICLDFFEWLCYHRNIKWKCTSNKGIGKVICLSF